MSNDARGSKKNKPNDANHVNAETKANQEDEFQKRITKIIMIRKNNGKVQWGLIFFDSTINFFSYNK